MSIKGSAHPPFDIETRESLDKVELTLDFLSAKTGAGVQRITLRGDGTVRLYFKKSFLDKHPKTLDKNCGPAAVLRLLAFMDGKGIMGMPDEFGGASQGRSQRVLELALPGRTKRIALTGACEASIEAIVDKVKTTAGLCLPEALNHRFFPNL